jgi:hypothetical protein
MRTELSVADGISNHRSCVVYDGRSGRIVHVHESITLEGGDIGTDETLEKRARELASALVRDRRDVDPSRLSVLILDPADLPETEGPFMVDVNDRVIVPLPTEKVGKSRRKSRGPAKRDTDRDTKGRTARRRT